MYSHEHDAKIVVSRELKKEFRVFFRIWSFLLIYVKEKLAVCNIIIRCGLKF